jgi:branched-chain amino acid transport system substrate-binding protein
MTRRMALTAAQYAVIAIVIVVAVGAAAAYVWWPRAPPAPSEIRIGVVAPLTGPLASFGAPDPWLASYIQNYINQNMGGIYMQAYGRRIPVQIILKDTQSSESTAATVTQQLITQDHVNLLILMHTPETIDPASAMAEKYGVPALAIEGPVDAWVLQGPYHWTYMVGWAFPQLVQTYIDIWNLAGNRTNGVVAVISTNDVGGQTFDQVFIPMAEAAGYRVVDLGLVTPGTTDYTPYIIKAKEANATILAGDLDPPDFATLWRQAHADGWVPEVVTVARANVFPSNEQALGDNLAYGISAEVWWFPSISTYYSPLLKMNASQWAQLYESATGREWDMAIGYDLGAYDWAVNVLERAGSLSPQAINQSIATTDMMTMAGPIDFQNPFPSPGVESLIAQQEPFMLQPQNKGHYVLLPLFGGQWVPSSRWGWKIVPIYSAGLPVETYPMVMIPANPSNATSTYVNATPP